MNRHQRLRDESIRSTVRSRVGGWRFAGDARTGYSKPTRQHFVASGWTDSPAICGAWFGLMSWSRPRANSRVPRCSKCVAMVERATA